MKGHATPEELARIAGLEARVGSGKSTSREALELAVSYLEPCHAGHKAITLLLGVVEKEPLARIWVAYCALHYTMDTDSLLRAKSLLEERGDSEGSLGAAISMLLPQVERELGSVPLAREIRLFERSVGLCPEWVFNHQLLALAYSAAGRKTEAAERLQIAKANVVSSNPGWSHVERQFEVSITGRASYRVKERIEEELAKLRN